MYQYIEGRLVDRTLDTIVVDANGIGYEIHMPESMSIRLGDLGELVRVYTVLNVRENYMGFVGFCERSERTLYHILTQVSGIGPKLALSILAALKPHELALAVIHHDVKTLKKVKGLGQKNAERIIIEVKDKMGTWLPAGIDHPDSSASHSSTSAVLSEMQTDVLNALIVLGYTAAQAEQLTLATFDEALSLEVNIQNALRQALK